MTKKYYTIKVGVAKPQIVEMGEINKATGLPMGKTEIAESVVGKITIPNYSKAYGIPERNDGDKLTGNFTPLEWGDEGGEVVELRYASNCNSLLKLYQEQIKLNFNGDAEAEITLLYGLNMYDPVRDRNLIRMLQLHTYNGTISPVIPKTSTSSSVNTEEMPMHRAI